MGYGKSLLQAVGAAQFLMSILLLFMDSASH